MAARKPNVLVFLTDQQRWDTSGLHGNPLGLTPNFDRLARAGTHLTQSITCQPVCGPARSCLQTGQYATNTGVTHNGIALREDATTLAKCFQQAGYATGYIGKWHLAGNENPMGPVPQAKRGGYDYWLAAETLELCTDAYDTRLYDGEGREHSLPGYRVDAITDAAIRYIDDHREEPFFLFLSHLEPHHQNSSDSYPAPEGYEERYLGSWMPPDLAGLGGTAPQHLPGYYGMVKRVDEALGRIQDVLISRGLAEDTIVLFSSDHGCHFKTRNQEYKRSCHEASVRVPSALWGGPFQGGGQIDRPVSLVDLPATLLDGSGIEVPDTMDGQSVLPLLKDRQAPFREEAFIQISESQLGRAVRTSRWKYSVSVPDSYWSPESAADSYTEEFLYDLKHDPYELCNLIESEAHGEVRSVMRNRLLRCLKEAGEPEAKIVEAKASFGRQPPALTAEDARQ